MIGDLVIAGCSRRKAPEPRLLPALERYTGGVAPQLRERFAGHRRARDRIRFLSAEHGLIRADDLLAPYDRALTRERAEELRPVVAQQLAHDFHAGGVPQRVLLVLEPDYLIPLTELMALPERPVLLWISDPHGWPRAAAVLDEWRWP
ncbi:DUF6884 domain-containing protein [Kitasatospora kifunensis]|uniref:DUF6884 domain-containing protein n=1 Tax=Kitasatospora kifunensis TaxID=58351 RepID=A0A7W7RA00_KITKI|nr:DUF6884 domain-containing protein [Kitasatospora kifunensis]MBB4927995.1 hypothetical protein [Kitasatospora kifunensis]